MMPIKNEQFRAIKKHDLIEFEFEIWNIEFEILSTRNRLILQIEKIKGFHQIKP